MSIEIGVGDVTRFPAPAPDAVVIATARPGDTIIVSFARALNMAEADQLEEIISSRVHPDIKVVIIDQVQSIVVARNEPA